MKAFAAICWWTIWLLLLGCSPKISSHFCKPEDLSYLPEEDKKEKVRINAACREPLAYAPDTSYLDHAPMRYIRVNFHFVNSEDSTHNFNGEEAINYAYNLVANANSDLAQNATMNLPLGNHTPVLPTNFRYLITPLPNDPNDKGVYFHYDNEVCYYVHKGKNQNLYNKSVIKKYAIQLDSVVNVFIMSLEASKTDAGGVGVTLGSSIKMAGMYDGTKEFWRYRQILNHEMGHVLSLQHSWTGNDGCEDTPVHTNCWNVSETPLCDSLYSNNVMDYNALQLAWTPCQIGKVHRMMSTIGAPQRKLIAPTWCQFKEVATITIADSIHWRGAKDIEGNIVIKNGGFLKLSCRLSLPPQGKIIIEPQGTLLLDNAHLHNDCGQLWQGVEVQTQGKHKGKLLIKGAIKVENTIHPFPITTSNP